MISNFQALERKLTGNVIGPNDPSYEEARSIWNGMIDRNPAMIVQCASVSDVQMAVKFAKENNLIISIKGGGHGVAGKAVCEGGLMLDMSNMNSVDVDREKQTVLVGPGTTLGEMDQETLKYGLVTTGGIVSSTGVAGLTLGGGIGYLARKYGLTIDNLLWVELVSANGKILECDHAKNSDLFWALRGGGGNFGVVTSFKFKLHAMNPEIFTAQIFYPMEDSERVMHEYCNLMKNAPDELAAYFLVVKIPPADPFPTELHGAPAIAFIASYCGDFEDGRKLLEPFQEYGKPIFTAINPMPYLDLQKNFNAGVPHGQRYYWKSCFFKEINDAAIRTFLKYASELKGPLSLIGFEPLGGAISRKKTEETAFFGRDANFALGIWLGWIDPNCDEENISWGRDFHKAMLPFASDGVYSNYLDQDDEDQVVLAYGKHYKKLQKVKAKYDPDNFFNQNHNIKPAD